MSKKIYRQIIIHEDDQDLQLILWRESQNEPVKVYRLTTVTHGLNCAPFLALATVEQLGIDEGDRFPLAAEVIKNVIYVDDLLSGADNLEDAIQLHTQLRGLFTVGGLLLKKWNSKSHELMQRIPEDLHALSPDISWQSENLRPVKGGITKRLLFCQSGQLFDPLGWLAPVIISVKIFIQELWKFDLSWNDPLSEGVRHLRIQYYEDLSRLSAFRIARREGFRSSMCSSELHGFAGASEKAYGSVAYLKVISPNGNCFIGLISSKTKVAPVQTVSLPRLELCASILLACLVAHLQNKLQFDATLHLSSDSMNTLHWISAVPTRWMTYVGNRVSEIQTTPSTIWHHVPGADNSADCASRGLSASALSQFSIWWNNLPWPKRQKE